MPIGDPGREQFRRAIVTLRNLHIAAALSPVLTMRAELLANDELSDRGGFDDPTRDHLIQHLVHCDRWRRRVTHNPDQLDLGEKIEQAIDSEQVVTIGENPFGGDDIQNQSGGLIDLPFALDGSDPDIPLQSSLKLKSTHALVLLGAIDKAIVAWTRLNSRDRTRFITRFDSMRIYGHYQELLGYLLSFGGDANRVDVAQVLPSEEPLGHDDSPNRRAESSQRSVARGLSVGGVKHARTPLSVVTSSSRACTTGDEAGGLRQRSRMANRSEIDFVDASIHPDAKTCYDPCRFLNRDERCPTDWSGGVSRMVPTVKLAFVIHNHQPVGNFDGVFEQAYEDSYLPFLDVLSDFPTISLSLHTSGSLLEWLVSHHPEYVDRVRSFVERGQIEILGGPFYEPILSAIPRRDRVGQMKLYTRYLEQTFGTTVKGMWVPERVWEPTFASDIVEGGIDYTILDDSHFRLAGLPPEDLHGYYVTEDEGQLLKIFPDDETLRYAIPWKDPEFTIDYLRGMAEQHPGTIVSFGDDGEKFGAWPGTKQHVFTDGWLRRFFEALVENSSWLKVITLAEAVRSVAPQGRAYLPNASYREMTEWALPTDQQQAYNEMVAAREHDPGWDQVKPFLRAGFWRNFLVKYPESNEMYCRSREISERLER
ncbi:4-alpha-D-glucan glucanohydrolase), partial [Durusdinium trenchii]